ncbi:hypothetical protein RI367_004000 [Sorochytrium milnesiophthora]
MTSSSSSSSSDRLIVLHVTDIHNALDNLRALPRALADQHANTHIDVVLVSGDNLCIHHPLSAPHDMYAPLTEQHVSDTNALFSALEALVPLDRVYWVPGNHDPIEFFSDNDDGRVPRLRAGVNVHGSVHRICPGLYIAGVGGSVPGVHLYRGAEQIWPGCPYPDDGQLCDAARAVLHQARDAMRDPSDRLLLMTHNGPAQCATTTVERRPWQKEDDCVNAGSAGLRELLITEEWQSSCRILVNAHGHSHFAAGVHTLGTVRVVNPGPMQNGRYGLMHLVRDSRDTRLEEQKDAGYPVHNGVPRWRVHRVELCEM